MDLLTESQKGIETSGDACMHACNQVNIHAGSKHTCTDMQRASIGFH